MHYDRMVYVLDQTPTALAAATERAEVVEYPDGRIVVRHGGADLPYRLFDKNRRVDQAAVAENKFFGPLLAIIREDQLRRDANTKPRRSIRLHARSAPPTPKPACSSSPTISSRPTRYACSRTSRSAAVICSRSAFPTSRFSSTHSDGSLKGSA